MARHEQGGHFPAAAWRELRAVDAFLSVRRMGRNGVAREAFLQLIDEANAKGHTAPFAVRLAPRRHLHWSVAVASRVVPDALCVPVAGGREMRQGALVCSKPAAGAGSTLSDLPAELRLRICWQAGVKLAAQLGGETSERAAKEVDFGAVMHAATRHARGLRA